MSSEFLFARKIIASLHSVYSRFNFFLIKIFSRKRVAASALSSRPFCLEVFALCRLLYVRNSFESRESRKRLFSIFRPRYWISPSRIPRENTRTLRRARTKNARKKARLSHLALVYHAFRGDAPNPFCVASIPRYNHSAISEEAPPKVAITCRMLR